MKIDSSSNSNDNAVDVALASTPLHLAVLERAPKILHAAAVVGIDPTSPVEITSNGPEINMTPAMPIITWSARNHSTFMTHPRRAKTLRGAVRAAREYLLYELYGEGVITYCVDGDVIRYDEQSIHTMGRMVTRSMR